MIYYLPYTPKNITYNVKYVTHLWCGADRVWWAALCQKVQGHFLALVRPCIHDIAFDNFCKNKKMCYCYLTLMVSTAWEWGSMSNRWKYWQPIRIDFRLVELFWMAISTNTNFNEHFWTYFVFVFVMLIQNVISCSTFEMTFQLIS